MKSASVQDVELAVGDSSIDLVQWVDCYLQHVLLSEGLSVAEPPASTVESLSA